MTNPTIKANPLKVPCHEISNLNHLPYGLTITEPKEFEDLQKHVCTFLSKSCWLYQDGHTISKQLGPQLRHQSGTGMLLQTNRIKILGAEVPCMYLIIDYTVVQGLGMSGIALKSSCPGHRSVRKI